MGRPLVGAEGKYAHAHYDLWTPTIMSVFMHKILKHATDFHETWHEPYATGDQPNAVEWKRNLTVHGDAREEKWRGKRRMVWVVSNFQFDSEQSIQCYYNRSPPTLTPRKPILDWTDTPTNINGLVRFAGRPNLVSARVPSHSVFTLPSYCYDKR